MTARVSPPVASREHHASTIKARKRAGRITAALLAAVFPLNSQFVDVKVPVL